MKISEISSSKHIKRERGVAAVEFALVAIIFFLLLLSVMEFGRLFYLWNTVQEVTRRAARFAVVNEFSTMAVSKQVGVFRVTDGNLPGSQEVSTDTVVVRYLRADGITQANPMPINVADNISACLDIGRTNSCVKFVEVSVCVHGNGSNANTCVDSVPFSPMVGLLSPYLSTARVPRSTVIMPAESLGFRPDL